MNKFISTAVVFGIFIIPGLVFAGPIIRSGDSVSVEAEQVLEGDFYGLGSTVTISGTANHDVYLAGGSVTVNAPVKQDLVIVGGSVNVHEAVEDDVRVVGGDVTIASHVTGDVVVAGGALKVLSTAQIDGDLIFYGGEIDISGDVGGSVIGVGERVRFDAGIGGDVNVKAWDSISLGDRTEILGNLEYKSRTELARAQGAVVVGTIQKKTIIEDEAADITAVLISLLILLFAAFTGYLLFKPYMQRIVDQTAVSYGLQGLIGLAVLLVAPFVGVLLIASVLGIIVGAIVLILYALLLFTSWVLSGVVIGTLASRYLFKWTEVSFLSILLGIVILELLYFVPFIGPLLVFALVIIVLGGISMRLYQAIR